MPEARHVEVQVSFRPISYISKLTPQQQSQLGAKHATSSKRRPPDVLAAGVDAWIKKKWSDPRKVGMRDACWPGLTWKSVFVHGEVREPTELALIGARGIELMPFAQVLRDLCAQLPGQRYGAAGTDIAEIVQFYNRFVARGLPPLTGGASVVAS